MEGVDHEPVARLEGKVVATGQSTLRGLASCTGNKQFIGPEIILANATHGHLQHFEDGLVEPVARLQVVHDQLQVVDQATTMQFIDFHGWLRGIGVGMVFIAPASIDSFTTC